jgi:CheY-like chemotaxis protein
VTLLPKKKMHRIESMAAAGNRVSRILPPSDSAATPRTSEIEVGALKGVTVLLVEDDPVSRDALEVVFTYYGAGVISTDSGDEALKRFDATAPSIVVSDIGLPTGDGYALLRAIRTREGGRGSRTPAIAVSGCPGRETDQRSQQAGFDAFLRKPVEIRRLLKLVADLATAPPS